MADATTTTAAAATRGTKRGRGVDDDDDDDDGEQPTRQRAKRAPPPPHRIASHPAHPLFEIVNAELSAMPDDLVDMIMAYAEPSALGQTALRLKYEKPANVLVSRSAKRMRPQVKHALRQIFDAFATRDAVTGEPLHWTFDDFVRAGGVRSMLQGACHFAQDGDDSPAARRWLYDVSLVRLPHGPVLEWRRFLDECHDDIVWFLSCDHVSGLVTSHMPCEPSVCADAAWCETAKARAREDRIRTRFGDDAVRTPRYRRSTTTQARSNVAYAFFKRFATALGDTYSA